jgi:RNA polymerase sigma-70 factor (ECF subfamily)
MNCLNFKKPLKYDTIMSTDSKQRSRPVLPDEASLLERVQGYDQQALAEVYDQYFDPIYRYISYRLGETDMAADLTGEVFLALVHALKVGKPPKRSLSGWLYAVARNVVADHIKAKTPTLPLGDNMLDETPSLTDQIYSAQQAAMLHQALLQLTEEQQHVIALRFGQGMSLAEAAHILGKSVGSIKALQHRALASLARFIPLEVNPYE